MRSPAYDFILGIYIKPFLQNLETQLDLAVGASHLYKNIQLIHYSS